MEKIKKIVKDNRVFLLILVLGSVIRLLNLLDRPIRHDEFATLDFIKRDFVVLFTSFLFNDEPFTPYYYLLIKLIHSLGASEVSAMRVPSVLFGILSIVALYNLGRNLKLKEYSLYAFTLFYSLSPAMVHYSQTGRMYSLFYFLFISVLSNGLMILNNPNPPRGVIIKYLLYSLLVTNIHYYGLVLTLILWTYLYVVKRNKRKPLVFILLSLFVCYTPWLYKTLGHIVFSQQNEWLSHYYKYPSQIFIRTAKYFLRGRFVPISMSESFLLFIIPVFFPLYRLLKRKIRLDEILLITIFYGSALLLLLKGIVGQNAYHPRYYLVLLPIFHYFYLMPISLFDNKKSKNLYIVALVIIFLVGTYRLGVPYWLYEAS